MENHNKRMFPIFYSANMKSLDIGPGKTQRLHVVTAVTMTESITTEKEALKRKNALEKSALAIVDDTLNIGANRLRDEHSKVGSY